MGSATDRIAFRHRPKLIHTGRLGPGHLKSPVPATSAKYKLVVLDTSPALKGHLLPPGVHTLNRDPGAKLNAVVPIPFRRFDEPAAEAFLTTQVRLGQGRAAARDNGRPPSP